MKTTKSKLFVMFLALGSAFVSCDKDDSPDPIMLPKTKTNIEQRNNETITLKTNFQFDGNRIKSVMVNDELRAKCTYTGDLITKIEELNGDGSTYKYTDYNYTNGKLESTTIKRNGDSHPFYRKTNYTHNANGTVSYKTFESQVGIEEGSFIEILIESGILTFANNNLVKHEIYNSDHSLINSENVDKLLIRETFEYEYDNKNNPYKNIVGYSVLLTEEFWKIRNVYSFYELIKATTNNNIVKITHSFTDNSNETETILNEYVYNKFGYPTEKKITKIYKSWNGGTMTDKNNSLKFDY